MIRGNAPRRNLASAVFGAAITFGMGAAGLLVLALPVTSASADEAVRARAALIEGGARLVFDWPAPVAFTTTVSGNRLTISFERPLAATFEEVLQALPGQVSDMQIGGNGQTVVVTLAQPSNVSSFAQGDLVVVDLTPSAADETPTAVTLATEQVTPANDAGEIAAVAPEQVPAEPAGGEDAASAAIPVAPVLVDGVLSVRYGLHDDYDRIVFDWPERVPYTVTNNGGLVEIQFEGSARIDADRLAARLPSRVRLVDASNEGGALAVSLAVSPGARVVDFYNLTKTVIDIYRDRNGAPPVSVPAMSDQIAADQPDAESEQPAIVAETLAVEAPPVPPVEPDRRSEAAEVAEVAEAPESAEAAEEEGHNEAQDLPPADDVGVPVALNENFVALTTLPPSLGSGANQPVSPAPVHADDEAQADVEPAAADAHEASPPAAHAQSEQASGHGEPDAAHGAPDDGAAQGEPVEMAAAESSPEGAEDHATRGAGPEQPAQPDAHASVEADHADAEMAAGDTVPVEVVVIGGDFEAMIRLRWAEPVRAAVVKRGDRIWISFDRLAEGFDPAVLANDAGPIYSDPVVVETPGGLVFSVRAGEDVEPRVNAAGNTWYVQMRPRRSDRLVDLAATRFVDPVLGPAIAFTAGDVAAALDPGEPMEVQDPEIGDRFVLVPLGAPSVGLPQRAAFVQFDALASAQGLAFERLSDHVVVRNNAGRVEVVASGGLTLSDDQAVRDALERGDVQHAEAGHGDDTQQPDEHATAVHGDDAHETDAHASADNAAAEHAGADHESDPHASDQHAVDADAEDGHGASEAAVAEHGPAPSAPSQAALPRGGASGEFRLFEPDVWQLRNQGRFANVSRSLQTASAVADGPTAREAARVRFARFLFGYNQFRDAGGVLRLIASETPQAYEADPSLIALRGATSLMNNDAEAALSDLSDPRLLPSGEAQYWRAAALAALGQHEAAMEVYSSVAETPDWYGDELRIPLGLAEIDTALAMDDIEHAEAVLGRLPYFGLEPHPAGEIALRRATAAWQAGDPDSAAEHWDDAIATGIDGIAAQAVFERTRSRFDGGEISAQEAAEALDEIRYDWRGGPFELDLLRQLAEYQFAAGDYRNGFRALKNARALFNDDDTRRAIDARLEEAFAELYGPQPPVNVSPVTAIALFSEFEDLAPTGPARDDMLRRLAGRLIAIDLYGQAATVLATLMTDDLPGQARGELARDLAVLYLADGRPQKAIDILLGSRGRGFSDELDDSLRHLRASAHLALDDYANALSALEGDTSRAANMLRAELHWSTADWDAAAQDFGRLAEGASFAWPPVPAPPALAVPDLVTASDDMADAEAGGDSAAMPALPSAEEAAALDAATDGGTGPDMAMPDRGFAARSAPLDASTAEQVLNWAMALTYADDRDGLSYLRQRYSAVMDDSSYADMFRLLVADDIGPITSVADLGRIRPNIDMFETFLSGYRERLKQDLSDPVMEEALPDTGADAGAATASAAG